MQYNANELNVFDISRNLSWPLLLRLCYCLHYDVTKVISDRGCELRNMEFQMSRDNAINKARHGNS